MKKIIALLLTVFVMLPIFSISSFAYHTFTLAEGDYRLCYIYFVDGKAFLSSDKAMSELNQTGKTTVFLPAECEGKDIYFSKLSFTPLFSLGYYNDGKLPWSAQFNYQESMDEEIVNYSVDFVCSENAQYDYDRQIGTSDSLSYVGYSLNNTRFMFLSQDELDTALNIGEIYIEDAYLRENPITDINEVTHHSEYNTGNGSTVRFGTQEDSAVIFEFNDNNNSIYCKIHIIGEDTLTYKTKNCSCNCHKSGVVGFIWRILKIFYKIFGMNKTCACGVAHY